MSFTIKRHPVVARGVLALIMSTCLGQALAQPAELSGLDDFAVKAMQLSQTPGMAIAVVQGNEVVLAKGYGVRKIGNSASVDKDTLFAIGSNSKYFTATALGLLVEEGLVDWDEPLTHYLPNLGFSDPYLYTEVSLRDALGHRTGLARADLRWYADPGIDRDQALAMIEHLPREIGFRSGFIYNNFMFLAAGQVIPAVTGQSWDEFVSQRIFKPLKMTRSRTTSAALKRQRNVAQPHQVIDGNAVAVPYYNLDGMAPAGSITSSVSDMANWCKVQLAAGEFEGEQVIPKAVLGTVRKPHNLIPLAKEGHIRTRHVAYALGIGRGNYGENHVAYMHTGGIDGMLSSFAFIPDAKLCVVALTNGSPNAQLHTAMTGYALDHLLGISDVDHLEKMSEAVKKQAEHRQEILGSHRQSADTAIKPTVSVEQMANGYQNESFGRVEISAEANKLRFRYGTVFVGELQHHRGNTFNVILDDPNRRSESLIAVTFAEKADGDVESLSLVMLEDPDRAVRFSAVARSADEASKEQ